MKVLKIKIVIFLFIILLPFVTSKTQAAAGFPLTVTDDFGRTVTIKSPPRRIVSTAPSNTEILFAIGAGDLVIGVTRYCDWPPAVLEKVKKGEITLIGGYADPSLEGVISLSPDLVLSANDLQVEFVSTLQNKGIVVVALKPKNLDDIVRNLALVGTICDKVAEANRLVENLHRRFSYVSERIAGVSGKLRVYYELSYNPMMSFGPSTTVDELITKAGGTNIFHDAPTMYPIVNSEMIISKDPEVILVPQGSMGEMGGTLASGFRKRAGWSNIKAVKENRINPIDESLLVRAGPRVYDGLENLAAILHPQLFTGAIHYNSSIAVTSNATVFGLICDNERSLLNFTVIGIGGNSTSVRVEIPQTLIKGRPTVLIDGAEKASVVSTSSNGVTLEFTTDSTRHNVVVGGSQTVPEFDNFLLVFLFSLLVISAVMRRHRPLMHERIRSVVAQD